MDLSIMNLIRNSNLGIVLFLFKLSLKYILIYISSSEFLIDEVETQHCYDLKHQKQPDELRNDCILNKHRRQLYKYK